MHDAQAKEQLRRATTGDLVREAMGLAVAATALWLGAQSVQH